MRRRDWGEGAHVAAGLGRRELPAAGGEASKLPFSLFAFPSTALGREEGLLLPSSSPPQTLDPQIIARFLDLADAASVGAFVAWAPPPLPIHQVQLQLMLPLIDRGMHRGGFPASVTCFSDPYALELVVFLDRLLLP